MKTQMEQHRSCHALHASNVGFGDAFLMMGANSRSGCTLRFRQGLFICL